MSKELKILIKKKGYNDFDYILWVYSAFEVQQYDTFGFSLKNSWK